MFGTTRKRGRTVTPLKRSRARTAVAETVFRVDAAGHGVRLRKLKKSKKSSKPRASSLLAIDRQLNPRVNFILNCGPAGSARNTELVGILLGSDGNFPFEYIGPDVAASRHSNTLWRSFVGLKKQSIDNIIDKVRYANVIRSLRNGYSVGSYTTTSGATEIVNIPQRYKFSAVDTEHHFANMCNYAIRLKYLEWNVKIPSDADPMELWRKDLAARQFAQFGEEGVTPQLSNSELVLADGSGLFLTVTGTALSVGATTMNVITSEWNELQVGRYFLLPSSTFSLTNNDRLVFQVISKGALGVVNFAPALLAGVATGVTFRQFYNNPYGAQSGNGGWNPIANRPAFQISACVDDASSTTGDGATGTNFGRLDNDSHLHQFYSSMRPGKIPMPSGRDPRFDHFFNVVSTKEVLLEPGDSVKVYHRVKPFTYNTAAASYNMLGGGDETNVPRYQKQFSGGLIFGIAAAHKAITDQAETVAVQYEAYPNPKLRHTFITRFSVDCPIRQQTYSVLELGNGLPDPGLDATKLSGIDAEADDLHLMTN